MAHKKYWVQVDVLIDDFPKSIRQYREVHPNANIFTIAYPYNEDVAKYTDLRLGSWRDPEVAWEAFVEAIDELSYNKECYEQRS